MYVYTGSGQFTDRAVACSEGGVLLLGVRARSIYIHTSAGLPCRVSLWMPAPRHRSI